MKRMALNFILSILMLSLFGCSQREVINIDADVLTINSEILEGKLIGLFLSSSNGWVKSDVIKVGVKFEIGNNLFLEDLKLSHAQLAYYKSRDTLPLKVVIVYNSVNGCSRCSIRLNGYFIKYRNLSESLAKELINYLRKRKEE